jgi:hypothetical protein
LSLELINTISAAVSALAIVISLVFVGLQIRASTRAQRALSAWQSENAWAQFNLEVARDPQTAELLNLISTASVNLEALQGTKFLQAHFMIRSLLQHAQSQYFLFREGSLSARDWRFQRNWVAKFVKLPLVAALLTEENDQEIVSSDFLAEIARVPAALK